MSPVALVSGPDTHAAFGAALFQEPVVESPLPGGVAAVVRFLFNLPQWFQIAGFILGVLAALALLAYFWHRRAAIVPWVKTRGRALHYGLAGAGAVALLGAAGFGTVSWNYMQHDNGFCTGCHVMGPAFQRFTESEHAKLECHDCHQQSIFASMRQLYLWVAERPAAIGEHAKVPTPVCATCHVTGDAKETWQRIASTAGHRTHLESDSSALRNVQCVTCHGVEVHRFAPVDATCAQSGCHASAEIKLAKMSGQTGLHCVTCHQFTAEVPALATRDSASGALVPGMKQCFSCHEMRATLAGFDPARDPHSGTCGMCHDPHAQKTPVEAAQTCASAQCHADWRSDPFHVGANHRAVGANCTLCHQPHKAKVDASDCAGCHAAVKDRRAGGRKLAPPMPFDTTRALRPLSFGGTKGKGDGPLFFDDPPPGGSATPPDTFPHDRHKSLSCITCHTTRQGRGRLTFQPPRGCQICHHQAPQTSDCAVCHQAVEIAAPESVTVRVTVAGRRERGHPARFDHATHRSVKCVACHTAPVTLDPGPQAAACTDCHDDHHAARRQCDACHEVQDPDFRAAHAPPVEAHVACDACHAPATVGRLVPDRAMCLSCHGPQRDHYTDRECTLCHFQATPETFRHHLRKRTAG